MQDDIPVIFVRGRIRSDLGKRREWLCYIIGCPRPRCLLVVMVVLLLGGVGSAGAERHAEHGQIVLVATILTMLRTAMV